MNAYLTSFNEVFTSFNEIIFMQKINYTCELQNVFISVYQSAGSQFNVSIPKKI